MENLITLFNGESWIDQYLVTEIYIINGYLEINSAFAINPMKYKEIINQLCAYGYECN